MISVATSDRGAGARSPFTVQRFVPKERRFPARSHDEFVISVNGPSLLEEHVKLDRRRFRVGTDDITLYDPGEVQSSWAVTRDNTRWECFSIHLDPAVVHALTDDPTLEVVRPVVTDPGLAVSLRRAAHMTDPHAAAEMATWVVAETLSRAGTAAGDRPQKAVLETTDLHNLRERMAANLHVPIRVPELASSVSMSPDHFIRSFVHAFGLPPYAWHLQLRLREGRRRLKAGQAPGQVAAELGFSDQAHCHRHFRAAYAQTPGYVRRHAV